MIISLSKNNFLNFIRNEWFLIFLLLIISTINHFIFFTYPSSVVFDEVHIGHYILEYLKGNFVFDVHPPLGRLIFVGFAILFGADINANFDFIGNSMPHWAILLRIVPMISGTLLSLLVYGILRKINISKYISFIAGLLICFENSLMVQSRFLLFDSILIFFGFLSIYLCLLYIKNNNKILALLSIIFASFAFSIKWTGLSFLFIIFFIKIYNSGIRNSIKFILSSFIIVFSIYTFIFSLNFVLLPNSGTGDLFMSPNFQSSLNNSRYSNDNRLSKLNFWSKYIEFNKEMIKANIRLINPHTYSSKWYTWPIEYRSIYYWNKMDNIDTDRGSYIYLLGNPFIYFAGLLSIIYSFSLFIYLLFKNRAKKLSELKIDFKLAFILFGFLINYIPFIFIGRIMFLYHYQIALIFAIMAIAYLLNSINDLNKRNRITFFVILISLLCFLYFSPLTYGLSISKAELESRFWLKSWK